MAGNGLIEFVYGGDWEHVMLPLERWMQTTIDYEMLRILLLNIQMEYRNDFTLFERL